MISDKDRRWAEATLETHKQRSGRTEEVTSRLNDNTDKLTFRAQSVEPLVLTMDHFLAGHRRDTERLIARWVQQLGGGA